MRIFDQWFIAAVGFTLVFFTDTAPALPQGYELLFSNAQGVATLTDADRQAIYRQLGLKTGSDGKTLVFVDSECPPLQAGGGDIQVQTQDLNGDQHPEVFVSLGSACMFGFAGTGIFLFTGDGAGHWAMHNLGAGMAVVQDTHHNGYADVMIGGPGFCQPVFRWDGMTYVFDRKVAEQPGGCNGQ